MRERSNIKAINVSHHLGELANEKIANNSSNDFILLRHYSFKAEQMPKQDVHMMSRNAKAGLWMISYLHIDSYRESLSC